MREYRNPNPIGVLIVIFVNVLVFIFTMLEPQYVFDQWHQSAFHLGLHPDTFTSQPWTLLTNTFVHDGLLHILFNMLTLYFFGMRLTVLVGETKFLITYFVGAVVGSAFYLLYALYAPGGSPNSVAVGASGAVFAVGGALAVLRPNEKVLVYFVIPAPLWVFVLGSFVILTVIPLTTGYPIAWQAHLGGLVVGLIAGFLFTRKKRERDRYLL
jgi:membrane associated rhomboid family serine protease